MESSREKNASFALRDILASHPSKSPAIAKLQPMLDIPLSGLRSMCDLCHAPSMVDLGGSIRSGAAITYTNADKLVFLRDRTELALKFYNDTNLKSFKLVKVCKINFVSGVYYGLTFTAQEDGSEECLVFRAVVYLVGGRKVLFVEIKDDNDEIKLLPGDDDYVSSERMCECEDCSPCLRKSIVVKGVPRQEETSERPSSLPGAEDG